MARRVLITGARAPAALDLARDFAAAGWETHLADSVKSRMTRWSSLPATHHHYPPPKQRGSAFRTRIVDLVDQHGIDLVVPTCEEVFHLAAPSLRSALGERLFAPDLESLRRLHDKFEFARAAQGWGLPAPESHRIANDHDLAQFEANSRDWVFKPRFSRFGDSTLIAPDATRLAEISPSQSVPWMAQRYVSGEEACFQGFAHRGKLVAFAAYSSDWRLGGGARYAFEPLPDAKSEIVRRIGELLAQKAQLHGQFACDVIFDCEGAPMLIECNPRSTSGVHLMMGEGHLARAIAEGTRAPRIQSQTAYLAPAMLLFGLPRAIATGRLREWAACLSKGHDAISGSGDRAPIAGAVADTCRFVLKGLKHNISTNAATTCDIEWNGEELEE